MKRSVLLIGVIVLAGAIGLQAAEEHKTIAVAPGGGGMFLGGGGFGPVQSSAHWYIDSTDKVVHLSDAQKKAIGEIFETRDKLVKEFQSQNAAKFDAAAKDLTKAFQSQDKEAISKANKAYQEAYAPIHAIMKKSNADLQNVLTPEQKTALEDSRIAMVVKSLIAPVQLSGEQTKQVKAAAAQIAKAGDHETLELKLPAAIEKVLTPEQKLEIAKQRMSQYVKAMYSRAQLTAEQSKQVEALVDKAAKAQAEKNVFDWRTQVQINETINALLTAQQKEAMRTSRGWSGGGILVGGAPAAGGAMQVIVQEGHEGQPGQSVVVLGEGRQPEKGSSATADNRAKLRDRIQRQRELLDKASQTLKKLEALGDDKKAEAHELWEQLENLEAQFSRTFAFHRGFAAPGQPGGGLPLPGASVLPGQPLNPSTTLRPGATLPPGASLPGQPANVWVRPLPGSPVAGPVGTSTLTVGAGNSVTITAAPGTTITFNGPAATTAKPTAAGMAVFGGSGGLVTGGRHGGEGVSISVGGMGTGHSIIVSEESKAGEKPAGKAQAAKTPAATTPAEKDLRKQLDDLRRQLEEIRRSQKPQATPEKK